MSHAFGPLMTPTQIKKEVVANWFNPLLKEKLAFKLVAYLFLCLQKILTLLEFANLDVQTHVVQVGIGRSLRIESRFNHEWSQPEHFNIWSFVVRRRQKMQRSIKPERL
nr:hypothetical protein [Tanacetum cinerariifolium]